MLALLLFACVDPVDKVDSAAPTLCADSLPRGSVEVVATGFEVEGTTGTEGLTFSPEGRLFVGGSALGGGGFVAEVFADGTWSILANVPGSVGLAWWRDRILVATGDTGDGEGGLVTVHPDTGVVEVVVTGIDRANFPAPTPWGTILVSNPAGETVWEVTEGAAGHDWIGIRFTVQEPGCSRMDITRL